MRRVSMLIVPVARWLCTFLALPINRLLPLAPLEIPFSRNLIPRLCQPPYPCPNGACRGSVVCLTCPLSTVRSPVPLPLACQLFHFPELQHVRGNISTKTPQIRT